MYINTYTHTYICVYMYVSLFMAWVQVSLPPRPLPEKHLAEGSFSGVTSLRGSRGKLADGSESTSWFSQMLRRSPGPGSFQLSFQALD